jgi:hypothetical protein
MPATEEDRDVALAVVSVLREEFAPGAPVAELTDELAEAAHRHGGQAKLFNAAGGVLQHLRDHRPALLKGGRPSNVAHRKIEHRFSGAFDAGLQSLADTADPASWWGVIPGAAS